MDQGFVKRCLLARGRSAVVADFLYSERPGESTENLRETTGTVISQIDEFLVELRPHINDHCPRAWGSFSLVRGGGIRQPRHLQRTKHLPVDRGRHQKGDCGYHEWRGEVARAHKP